MSIQKYFRGKLLDSSEKKRRCLGFRFPMDAGHRTVLPLSVKKRLGLSRKPGRLTDCRTALVRASGKPSLLRRLRTADRVRFVRRAARA